MTDSASASARQQRGIAFADDYAPVMLGSDGRVWDGHHRIVLAIEQRIPSLMVEVVTRPGTQFTASWLGDNHDKTEACDG